MDDLQALGIKIMTFVASLEAEGFDKAAIGVGLMGVGAGLIHHHSTEPGAMETAINGIREAMAPSGQTTQ